MQGRGYMRKQRLATSDPKEYNGIIIMNTTRHTERKSIKATKMSFTSAIREKQAEPHYGTKYVSF